MNSIADPAVMSKHKKSVVMAIGHTAEGVSGSLARSLRSLEFAEIAEIIG